jgi:hypothetical protein
MRLTWPSRRDPEQHAIVTTPIVSVTSDGRSCYASSTCAMTGAIAATCAPSSTRMVRTP